MIRWHSWPLLTEVLEHSSLAEQDANVGMKTGTVSFDSSIHPRRTQMLIGQRNGVFYSIEDDHSIDQVELPHSVHRQLLHQSNSVRNLGNNKVVRLFYK